VNLRLIPRLRDDAPSSGPFVSVVIPARNEAENIEATVRAFLAQTYSPLEIIVVDDRSTDDTSAIVERLAAGDSRLRVIPGSETPPGWLGKPWALEQGSRAARGENLLLVDADIVYEPAAVGAAVAELQRSGAAMLTLLPHLVMKSAGERLLLPQLALTIFSFLPTWLSNRTTLRHLAIGGGTGNLVWRHEYDAAGGHGELRNAVVDDVALARLLRRGGRRTVVARAEHLTSVRIYAGLRGVLNGFTKNMFAVCNRSYLLCSLFVILAFVFHVLPYGFAAAGHALSLATVALITVTRLIVFVALRYRLHYALWAHPLMVLLWMWIAVRSMWITGVRRQLAWRGRSYDARGTRFGA
jgi:chlorobactene glucosyltransferase